MIFHELRSAMPKMGGRDRKQKELIAGLEDVFFKVRRQRRRGGSVISHPLPLPPHQVMRQYGVAAGDFPDVNKFRHTLATSEA